MATTTNNGWTTPNDSDPFKQGASAIRTLGSAIDTSVGTGLLTWTAYTPSFNGFSLGNGSLNFKYAKLGKIVHVRGQITLGSTSSFSGGVVDVPFNWGGYILGHTLGEVCFTNNSVYNLGTNICIGNVSNFRLIVGNAASTYLGIGDINATVPFTWASGHKMFITYTYEAA